MTDAYVYAIDTKVEIADIVKLLQNEEARHYRNKRQ